MFKQRFAGDRGVRTLFRQSALLGGLAARLCSLPQGVLGAVQARDAVLGESGLLGKVTKAGFRLADAHPVVPRLLLAAHIGKISRGRGKAGGRLFDCAFEFRQTAAKGSVERGVTSCGIQLVLYFLEAGQQLRRVLE